MKPYKEQKWHMKASFLDQDMFSGSYSFYLLGHCENFEWKIEYVCKNTNQKNRPAIELLHRVNTGNYPSDNFLKTMDAG